MAGITTTAPYCKQHIVEIHRDDGQPIILFKRPKDATGIGNELELILILDRDEAMSLLEACGKVVDWYDEKEEGREYERIHSEAVQRREGGQERPPQTSGGEQAMGGSDH